MNKTFAYAGLGPIACFALISCFLLLSPTGCGDSSGDDEADAADDMDTAATDTTSETGTTDTTDTTSETDTTDTTGSTAPDPSCPSEAPSSGDWLFGVDGDFPDDVPTDVDESCSVLVGAQEGELALGCPFGNLALSFYLDPAPSLPAPGTTAQLRLHHEPGWLLWPNIWISVDVDGGDLYGLQSSSVLYPVEG
ncbi:MAG: hypothetical protein KC457_30670, partial [Myxococcales bacterium]|nr:hypothetical protein [Myxococcales bacterium]